MERLQHEFEAIGFFLSGHPLDAYASVLAKLGIVTLRGARGARRSRRDGRPACRRRRLRARAPLAEGQQVRLRHVLGATGQFEAVIFSETLARLASSAGAGNGGAAHRWKASATAMP